MFDEITQQEALDVIVRAAMKRTYDKGDHITNGRAFADSVTRQAVENDAAIPGSLRLAYNAAVKTLADGEPNRGNTAAYQPWNDDDDHAVAEPGDAKRWMRIIAAIQKLPREHPLRRSVRDRCIHVRPWDAENRRPTPEEEAEYEERALDDLAHLELVAAENGIILTDAQPAALVTLPSLDDLDPDDEPIVARSDA